MINANDMGFYSLVISILSGLVIMLMGFNFKSQIKRIDKHDECLEVIRNDISQIKADVAYIKGKFKISSSENP